MKNTLLLLIFTTFFISCSDDNVETITNNNSNKSLKKINQITYSNGTIDEKITFIFENNKHKIDSFYTSNNQLTFYSKYNYNSNGSLSSIKGYDPNGTLEIENNYTYDNLDRITQVENIESSYSSTYNFTFNNNNTITSEMISNGVLVNTKIYYLNNNEIIFKEENGNGLIEVTYDSYLNLTQKNSFGNTTNYEYNLPTTKPNILQYDNSTFLGPKKINAILYGNSLDDYAGSFGNKYMTKETRQNGDIINYEYIFDADNYPTNIKVYRNNQLVSELLYTYTN